VAISKAAQSNRRSSEVLQYRGLLYQYLDQCVISHSREIERADELKYYQEHIEQLNRKAQEDRQQFLKELDKKDPKLVDANIMASDIKNPKSRNPSTEELENDGEYEDMEVYSKRNYARSSP
jgi:hypothetical protein